MDRDGVGVLQSVKCDAGMMRAGVLHGSRDVRLESVEQPEPGPGQVRLRVRRAGICGSDIHYFAHGYCGRFVPTRPFVLGHEFVATVDALGCGVQSPTPGLRVVVNPAASCGHCDECRSGRGNLCSRVVMLGSASTTPPTDGAFAEYVVVPASQCFDISQVMSDEEATMMEPLSVALHAIRRAGGVAGRRVAVAGGGPIGLLTARAARALGATLVVVSEPADARRGAALELVADDVLSPLSPDFVQQAVAQSAGGFDVVFEASGSASAVRGSLEIVRRGGCVVQVGTVGGNDVSLPVNDIMVREISFHGTFRYADEFSEAIRLVSSGRIGFDGLVTSSHSFDNLATALEAAAGGSNELKVHVTMDGADS